MRKEWGYLKSKGGLYNKTKTPAARIKSLKMNLTFTIPMQIKLHKKMEIDVK